MVVYHGDTTRAGFAVILWAVGYLVFTGRRLPSVFTEEVMEEPITIETTETYEGSVTDAESIIPETS